MEEETQSRTWYATIFSTRKTHALPAKLTQHRS